MSTAAGKARKRAGIPFTRTPKTPTPPELRSFVTADVFRRPGDAMPAEYPDKARWGGVGPRSKARVEKFIESGGVK